MKLKRNLYSLFGFGFLSANIFGEVNFWTGVINTELQKHLSNTSILLWQGAFGDCGPRQ